MASAQQAWHASTAAAVALGSSAAGARDSGAGGRDSGRFGGRDRPDRGDKGDRSDRSDRPRLRSPPPRRVSGPRRLKLEHCMRCHLVCVSVV